jgi:hypothetical protein
VRGNGTFVQCKLSGLGLTPDQAPQGFMASSHSSRQVTGVARVADSSRELGAATPRTGSSVSPAAAFFLVHLGWKRLPPRSRKRMLATHVVLWEHSKYGIEPDA